jgi:hypothetical protein
VLFRQSLIKTWVRCPLILYWEQIEGLQREEMSASTWGTCMHEAVMKMEMAYDWQVGHDVFTDLWDKAEYDYLLPRTSHKSYLDMGHRAIRDWWFLIQWESDVVLAREYTFTVPIGEHELTGTVDKLALRTLKHGEQVVLVSDYKTSSKVPTRDYLAHDLQFTSYAYATTQSEFWVNIPDGQQIFEKYANARRFGEWCHLRNTKRLDAGPREQYHYNRLNYAVDQISQAVTLGIFPPNISGEACEYCEYRKPCGLPSRIEEGLE